MYNGYEDEPEQIKEDEGYLEWLEHHWWVVQAADIASQISRRQGIMKEQYPTDQRMKFIPELKDVIYVNLTRQGLSVQQIQQALELLGAG